jgi:mitochondrial fission protein ELM1
MAGSCYVQQITAVIIKVNIRYLQTNDARFHYHGTEKNVTAAPPGVKKQKWPLLCSTGAAMRRTHTAMLSILKGRLHHMTNSSQQSTTITIIIPKLLEHCIVFPEKQNFINDTIFIIFI